MSRNTLCWISKKCLVTHGRKTAVVMLVMENAALTLTFARWLQGLDATAARSCFLMLKVLMQSAGVTVVFAEMSPQIECTLLSPDVAVEGGVSEDPFCVGYAAQPCFERTG